MSKPVVSSLYAGDRRVTDLVDTFEVRVAAANHSLIIVDLVNTPTSRIIAERTPVQVAWGQAPDDVEQFYGYVHHSQSLSPRPGDVRGNSVMRYVLIGTSLPMNQQRTRSWNGVSGSYLARLIAKEHGLRAVVHKSPRVYPYLAQNGNSDWALLKQLAADVGFRLWVNGSTLWFVDPTVMLSSPSTNFVPNFAMNNRAGSVDGLLGLEVVNGTMVADGGVAANFSAYGYDPRQKRFFKATAGNTDAYLQQVAKTSPIESLAEANDVLAANVAAGRNWLSAKARVTGVARLRPGSVVSLSGSSVLPDYQGLWLVESAVHNLIGATKSVTGANDYTTDLELSRDNIRTLTFKDAQPISPSIESVPCRLTDQSVWQAALLEETYVG